MLAVIMALIPLALPAVNTITYTATYDFNRLVIGSDTLCGETYATIHYDGLFNDGAPGAPSLPVDYIRFSVPYNATGFTVTATPLTEEASTFLLDYPVYPCKNVGLVNDIAPAYTSGTTYPVQQSRVVHDGYLAGENHIVTVEVSPFSYLHSSGDQPTDAVTGCKAFILTLNYELGDRRSEHIGTITRRDTTLRNQGFDKACAIVVNPGDVRPNSLSLSSDGERTYPPGPVPDVEDPLTYIIVTTPESNHPMRRLAALKRQKGIPVKMVTVNKAVADPLAGQGDVIEIDGIPYLTFTDNAGKLRQYLRENYYYNGTEYVLLAGTGVPMRDMDNGYSDHYYSDLSADWNYSSDLDNHTELNVGRLLGSDRHQFDNYTEKLLRYELNPGNGNRSYLSKAVATEGTDYFTLGYSTCLSPTYTTVTLVSSDMSETEVSGSDVINMINSERYGLMTTFNDGFPTGFRVYGEDENLVSHYIWAIDSIKVAPGITDAETGNGLNLLNNKLFPMIHLSFLGQTIPYTAVTGYGTSVNLGESFTTGKEYGGPAYLGMTYPVNSSHGSNEASVFLNRLVNGQTVIGETLADTRSSLALPLHEDVVLFSNLLGDPMLDVWTSQPQTYSGITVSRTDNSVTVSGIPSGTSKVAYYSNDGTTGITSCSSSSVTLNGVSPNSTVMLYRHDYIPYIAPLVLQNTDLEESQYVIAGKVTAGYAVDNGRTHGDVTVKSGTDYEIEATGEVILGGGFNVESGASLTVIHPDYR